MTSVNVFFVSPQTTGASFPATVVVTGAPLGANVSVMLHRTQGGIQDWGPKTQLSAGGDLSFTFGVLVPSLGPTSLVTETSDDQATFYPIAQKDLQVVK
jgi:hypothetical protein